jgi:Ser/Thr protein kinase RdoA (MazF antagonist)
MNFWKYVTTSDAAAAPVEIGRTLAQCHQALRSLPEPLPTLAILTESLSLLDNATVRRVFAEEILALLHQHLTRSLAVLQGIPHQTLHGDAHLGNVLQTTTGLLWTDWEDAFVGPVEWDVASAIWNAELLDGDTEMVNDILVGYQASGRTLDPVALHQCLVARAAVMSVWYPILYPNPNVERQAKLQRRLAWLQEQ